ncbi:DUF5403 family protein [Microbacterium sp. VKM Ac-2923]|uniref:DUF5403 family protein n=1 Tax=Microbacterium sp. VKM Ac-2923 TaxID=2929476 RepID=UPI001FB4FB4F|nr:DUF5403 family protein [Microbacterium sp. VKM Ac-2923]MCJ1709229.1 DUF5403 family protein [Microbacterium sp. VKM Ac-2923]
MADSVFLFQRNRVTAAQIAGDSAEFSRISGRVLIAAKVEAARHVDTGAYLSKLHMKTVPGMIGTGRGVKDRLIVADDPAAASIEWGHLARVRDGVMTRVEGSRRVKWEPAKFVPGKHIMTNALGRVR